ncbi:MAG: TonB-dependent receptor [Opitutales bacterium]|nr:TonB-dependent receptor [Opitutales bacterium]
MCSLYAAVTLGMIPGISAWSAVISGTVYDQDNAIYLEGVRVSIPSLERSVTTDRGGRYRFSNVPEGSFTVVATPTGVPAERRPVVLESVNDEVTMNFLFTREGQIFDLEAFAVEGSLIGAAKAMDIRRAARDYREVVSSDAFGQFTDRNPAEALQRAAGVTMETDQGDGSFVIVRGGAPEYSSVQIDGVSLATPEEDGRRVNMNVITNDQIERIELSKTWLPEQKGNVIGGTVNLITRSALDRGSRFARIETSGTYRDHQDRWSYRGAVTYGEVIDGQTLSFLGEGAIGLQLSVNQGVDYSGSDTVTWGWNLDKGYPFRTRPGEDRPRGFSLQNLDMRHFNIERDRQGASGRLEYRINPNHEVYLSASYNRFEDTVNEHLFSQSLTDSSQFYSGTQLFTSSVAQQLDADLDDPFNAERLAMSPNNTNKRITFNEAIQLGQLAYDEDNRLFTRGGLWPLNMSRTYRHTLREDRITTYQLGGTSRLPMEIDVEWKLYNSEARQDSELNWMDFATESSTGSGAIPVAGVENPYIQDPGGDNPVISRKGSFGAYSNLTGRTVHRNTKTLSLDERSGGDLDVSKEFDVGSTLWTTQIGFSLDRRDKEYRIDRTSYGLAQGSLDPERWPTGVMTLADPFFDGGDIEGFRKNFGEELRFGPSFHEANTLAFMKGEQAEGLISWNQVPNMINNDFTARVQNNYDSTEDISGFYFQQSIEWRAWTAIFGARYERTENSFRNLEIITDGTEGGVSGLPPFISPALWRLLPEEAFGRQVLNERDYSHLLPAVHVIRTLGENAVVRASVTKTISRPLFSDLIPREIPSISGGNFQSDIQLPAFDLEATESVNLDLSLDYYFEPIGMFSVAVYYKELDGPIYDEVRLNVGPNEETAAWALKYDSRNVNWQPGDPIFNDNDYTFRRKRNAGKGALSGAEITFNRRFDFLPGVWNGFGINSNIAWFSSRAELLTEARFGETVNLFKQPKMTGNLALYFEKHGLYARLGYNMRGRYLDSVSGGTATVNRLDQMGLHPNSYDIMVDRRSQLDLSLRYRIRGSFQVFAEASNLTNEPFVRIRRDRSRPHSRQYTGQVYTIGVNWTL